MKKLITLLLILAMLLPAAALADRDPIVGTWYVYSGIAEKVELRKDIYLEINLFHFAEDGYIFSSTYDISEEGITTAKDYQKIGMWTNDNGRYYVNIGLKGPQELTCDGDSLFFPVSDYSIRVHRMTVVNFTKDIMQ